MSVSAVDAASSADLEQFVGEEASISPQMLSTADKTQKVAVVWSKHLADPQEDKKDVFSSHGALKQRAMLEDQMKCYGKQVVKCEDAGVFYNYLRCVNQSAASRGVGETHTVQQIDTLLIRAHGNSKEVGDMYIEERLFSKDEVVTDSPELPEAARSDFMSQLAQAMKPGSVVILDSCQAGNKSVNNNFAAVLSRQLPGVKVIAAQESIIPRYTNGTGIRLEMDRKTKQVAHARMTAQKDIPGTNQANKYDVQAVEYVDGKELTGQEPVHTTPSTQSDSAESSKFQKILSLFRS